MNTKTFRGKTAKEVLARVSRELGPDADIVNRRLLQDEGGNNMVEVTAVPRVGKIAATKIALTFWHSVFKNKVLVAVGGGALIVIVLIIMGAVIFWPKAEETIPTKQKKDQTISEEAQPIAERKMIAVLPFENLGSPEDEYFADGITDEITVRLARIGGLGVISHFSAMQYKGAEKSTRTIGEELGVDYLLTGTIRWRKLDDGSSRVRITPRLISVRYDTNLWAENYEKDLHDIFALQASIAGQVASSLNIELLEGQRETLAAPPTPNLQAYNYYLRGRALSERVYNKTTLRNVLRMYEKAVELDPGFALAHAYLSIIHSAMYALRIDWSEERIVMAREAVDKAFALSPGLPEAHAAMGYYYCFCLLEFDRALEQYNIAMRGLGRTSEVSRAIAYVKQIQGRWEEAADYLHQALELEPDSAILARELAITLQWLRKFAEAEKYFDLALSLKPDNPFLYFAKIFNVLLWDGDTRKAFAILEEVRQNARPGDIVEGTWNIGISMTLHMCAGKYREALERLSEIPVESFDNFYYFTPKVLISARIYRLLGRRDLARRDYESARGILEDRLENNPEDRRLHSVLGLAYAGLGMKSEAEKEGELGVELWPVSQDYRGIFRVVDLAHIYTMTGEHDKAIDRIEYLLSVPSPLSISYLRIDPRWDPLREHPRFQNILREVKQYSR